MLDPERRTLALEPGAKVHLPQGVKDFLRIQTHFIAFIETPRLWPLGIETAVQLQKVGVVLVTDAKAAHD
ncbi:hypothetical protein D3C81_2243010 [compost metagenome]